MFRLSLELALFRTYAVPRISKVLAGTHQFSREKVGKRYDDTSLLVCEFEENFVEESMPGQESDTADVLSQRARAAIGRMNLMHSHYNINHDDMAYVWCLFVLWPYRFLKSYGWREMTRDEARARYLLWKRIAKEMMPSFAETTLPKSLEETERFLDEYEEQYMVNSDSNQQITYETYWLMLCKGYHLPEFLLKPYIWVLAFLAFDDRLAEAVGYGKISSIMSEKNRTKLTQILLLPVNFVMRFVLFPRLKALKRTGTQDPVTGLVKQNLYVYVNTYPDGYIPTHLGPDKFEKGKIALK